MTQPTSSQRMDMEDGKVPGQRGRHGLPDFYKLLEEMATTHDAKSHDYASNADPTGNYHFAGRMALLFSHSPEDAGFFGRIAEKVYRLSNLESQSKTPRNETVEDTERDIAVITCLWMADRRKRRNAVKVKCAVCLKDTTVGQALKYKMMLKGEETGHLFFCSESCAEAHGRYAVLHPQSHPESGHSHHVHPSTPSDPGFKGLSSHPEGHRDSKG